MKRYADIFIPASKNPLILARCLDGLARQSDKSFRLIVVSLKKKEVRSVLKKYPTLDILHIVQKDKGLVNAANIAFKHSKYPFFIRIDDDVYTPKRWFSEIIRTFSEGNKVGAVTGPTFLTKKGQKARDSLAFLSSKKSNLFMRCIRQFYFNYLYEGKAFRVGTFFKSGTFSVGSNFKTYIPKYSVSVSNFEACNFAVRRYLLLRFKGFDTAYQKGLGEYHEADIAQKVIKAGYTIIFNPNAHLTHHIESDSPRTRADSYHRIQNFIYFYKRHIGPKNADYFLRFLANVLAQDAYYTYKFLKTGDVTQLGAIPGSIAGLLK